MENITHSFVVVGVDTSNFPPKQFSTVFWEIPPKSVADYVAGAVAAAYETIGHGEIEIRIVPITA